MDEPKPWIVTGHSMGAALATVFAHAQMDSKLQVYTLGVADPHSGNLASRAGAGILEGGRLE